MPKSLVNKNKTCVQAIELKIGLVQPCGHVIVGKISILMLRRRFRRRNEDRVGRVCVEKFSV